MSGLGGPLQNQGDWQTNKASGFCRQEEFYVVLQTWLVGILFKYRIRKHVPQVTLVSVGCL